MVCLHYKIPNCLNGFHLKFRGYRNKINLLRNVHAKKNTDWNKSFPQHKSLRRWKQRKEYCYVVSVHLYGIEYWTISFKMKKRGEANLILQKYVEDTMAPTCGQERGFTENGNNKETYT